MKMSSDKQLDKLNSMVKCRIAPSKIHGVGIFAIRDIYKGEKLYLDHMPEVYSLPYSSFGKLFPEVKALLLERWPQIVNGSHFISPDARLLAYCNHAEREEGENYDAINDEALEDIKKGKEVFENYRLIPGHEKVFDFLKDVVK